MHTLLWLGFVSVHIVFHLLCEKYSFVFAIVLFFLCLNVFLTLIRLSSRCHIVPLVSLRELLQYRD